MVSLVQDDPAPVMLIACAYSAEWHESARRALARWRELEEKTSLGEPVYIGNSWWAVRRVVERGAGSGITLGGDLAGPP